MEEVLLLYSGGLDSMLSACYLAARGYHVNLIHFDNGSSIGTEMIIKGAKKLEERFGSEKITYLGIVPIVGVIRSFHKIKNLKCSEILETYGNTTISQYQCLACRSAMYWYAAMIALEKGIPTIAEGARKSQQFVIEQPPMMKEYEKFLSSQGLTLLTPVYHLDDDYERICQLERFRMEPVAYEGKCLLGHYLEEDYPVDEEIIDGTVKIFQETILPEMNQLANSEIEKGIIRNLEYHKKKVKWR